MRKWLLMLVLCYCAAIAAGDVIWGRGNPRRWTTSAASWTDTNSSHLVSHWDMEETNATGTVDASGNSHDAVSKPDVATGPQWDIVGTNQNGRVERAYTFNGTSRYFTAPDASVVTGANAFTWCTWFIPDVTAIGFDCLFSYGITAVGRQFAPHWDVISNADIYVTCDSMDVRSCPEAAPSNVWTHVGVIYSGGAITTNTMQIYTNGVLAPTILVAGGTPSVVGDNVEIGRFFQFVNRWVQGRLDDMRIYDIAISTGYLAEVVANTHPTNNIEARP